LYGSLLQALIALLVANIDVLALTVAVIGASVPLSIACALYTSLEVGEGNAIGEAATILCGRDRDRLRVASRTLELVEVLCAEAWGSIACYALVPLIVTCWNIDTILSTGTVGGVSALISLGVA